MLLYFPFSFCHFLKTLLYSFVVTISFCNFIPLKIYGSPLIPTCEYGFENGTTLLTQLENHQMKLLINIMNYLDQALSFSYFSYLFSRGQWSQKQHLLTFLYLSKPGLATTSLSFPFVIPRCFMAEPDFGSIIFSSKTVDLDSWAHPVLYSNQSLFEKATLPYLSFSIKPSITYFQ